VTCSPETAVDAADVSFIHASVKATKSFGECRSFEQRADLLLIDDLIEILYLC